MIAVALQLAPFWLSRPVKPSEDDKISGSIIAEFDPKESISFTSKAPLFQGMLRNVKDYTPLNEEIFNEQGYQEVLDYLKTAKPEDLKQSVKGVNYNNYFADTQKLRGEVVTIIGLIIRTGPVRLPKPVSGTSGNIEFMYRTYLVDTSGTEGYVIDLVEKPGKFEFRKDVVKVKGIFYKMVTYEGKKGNEKEVPLSIGIRLEPFINEFQAARSSMKDAVTIIALIMVAMFVLGFGGYFIIRLFSNRLIKSKNSISKKDTSSK